MDIKRKRPPDGAACNQTQKADEPSTQYNIALGDVKYTGPNPKPSLFERMLIDTGGLPYLGTEIKQAEEAKRLVETATRLPPIQKSVIHRAIKKHTGFGLGVLKAQEREYLKYLKARERYGEGGAS